MEQKLFIYTFADGRYKVYTDLWRFCIQHEYPEYRPMVFTRNVITQSDPRPKHYAACMRYLMEPPIEYYPQHFQYFYITDVDMFIVREETTLMDFHIKELQETGQCFSNARRGPGEPQGVNRVTGLHFGHKDWFEKTRPARDKYIMMLRRGEIGQVSIDDELMLAKIITESGLELPPQNMLVKRHHGIHLGTVRDKRKETIEERRRAFRVRVRRDMAMRWMGIIKTQEYRSIFNKINNFDRDAAWELRETEKFVRQMANEMAKK